MLLVAAAEGAGAERAVEHALEGLIGRHLGDGGDEGADSGGSQFLRRPSAHSPAQQRLAIAQGGNHVGVAVRCVMVVMFLAVLALPSGMGGEGVVSHLARNDLVPVVQGLDDETGAASEMGRDGHAVR